MTVRIAGDRLRIVLTQEETALRGIELSRRDAAGAAKLRRALLRLLAETPDAEMLFGDAALLWLEIRADQAGGCVVTCRADQPAQTACEPLVFAFSDAEALIGACVGLFRRHGHRILKSRLYPGEPTGYRMVISPLDGPTGRVARLLGEYGQRLPGGALTAALLEEHVEPILEEEAVDTLCYYFDK